MKGGNEASAASGITHSPERRTNGVRDSKANLTQRCGGTEDVREERKEMEGGNGVREANVVTLCTKCETPYYAAGNLPWM